MTPSEINCIVANAFNGMGDSTGSDDFGYSAAWIDLAGYVEAYDCEGMPANDTESLSAVLIAYVGQRYALATIDSNGNRDVAGFPSRAEMMEAFRICEGEYLAWSDETPHEGHHSQITGAWYCDTCDSPYCELA